MTKCHTLIMLTLHFTSYYATCERSYINTHLTIYVYSYFIPFYKLLIIYYYLFILFVFIIYFIYLLILNYLFVVLVINHRS